METKENVRQKFKIHRFILGVVAIVLFGSFSIYSKNENKGNINQNFQKEIKIINPYQDVNWNSVKRISSATHMHILDQQVFDYGYKYGIRHFPISNYYPSAPYNADTRISDFRLRQNWSARKTNGEIINPPINWNEIITWKDSIDEPYHSNLPFSESGLIFNNIPKDVIISPNAEHHGFSNSNSHICSLGSYFSSGNFDVYGKRYGLKSHDFCVGYGGTWQKAFDSIIIHLKYPDSGGITINHPTWFSQMTDEQVFKMLDFDDRVLGIEIYNDYSARRDFIKENIPGYRRPKETERGFSLNMWDRILSTGRRCWGFSVPDHSVERPEKTKGRSTNWNGRNVLLVPQFTEHECLKAYRQGTFYGCLKDNGLTVTNFSASETSVSLEVNLSATIKFISEAGNVKTVKGKKASFNIAQNNGKPNLKYVRIEVSDETGERLFLQPVIYQ